MGRRCNPENTRRRLELLKHEFDFDSCMIHDCKYNRLDILLYEVYKFKDGKYEIGNMFAICPNHMAEIRRKLISVKKINDYTLEIGW